MVQMLFKQCIYMFALRIRGKAHQTTLITVRAADLPLEMSCLA